MKKMKVSILALSALAGGILAASAASTVTTYRAYELYATYTNADAKVWSVNGGPETPPGAIYPQFVYQYGSVDTDGAGKIYGVGVWHVYYNTNHTPFSLVYADIAGKLTGKIGSPASVTMTIKGNGYTADGLGYADPGMVNLKFTGQPGVNPAYTNNQAMLGILTGTITGYTPLGAKYKIPAGRVSYINSSDWDYASFNADILQSSKGKMQLMSAYAQGTGTIKSDITYKATAKGLGWYKGMSVAYSGTVGIYTNGIMVGTNTIVVPFLAPKTADIAKTSKVNGQAIQGSASSVGAYLVY